ncbi:MAG: hypothetical protein ACI90U_002777 [Pseudomonadales bacterium]|jgi:hypothetical protein
MGITDSTKSLMAKFKLRGKEMKEDVADLGDTGKVFRGMLALALILMLVATVVGWYWSGGPEFFDVEQNAQQRVDEIGVKRVVGSVTTAATIEVITTLLEKPGGFIRNDRMPPGIFMDNMPNWEYGALVQSRDMVRALREGFSRSQSQSKEDVDLTLAEPRLNFQASSWILPTSEGEYRDGLKLVNSYLRRLSDPENPQAQFYARADNLRFWLGMVSTRLGSLSQNLSASVGQRRINTDLANDIGTQQSTPTSSEIYTKTPWAELDDVFYQSRGATWALIHFLRAVEIDFAEVLDKKNARASLSQIIRELEQTQDPIYSPFILNGDGFGFVANHSLVMASYISRANAALIDLRSLLSQG